MIKRNKGQAAIILILLTGVALIFYAISLNWGRIAQVKTLTMSAATRTAASLDSSYASYGEKVLYSSLGGNPKICKSGNILMALITLGIAIIVAILCWGVCIVAVTPLLLAAIALSAINLALQVLVVQPGLTSMWNKMQANLAPAAMFVEQGVQGGVQGVITDQVSVTDYFDLNTNGMQGFNGARPEDMISRFGIYYTERLKSIQRPNSDDMQTFINGLKSLSTSLDSPCKASCNCNDANCHDARCADPHCNPCCVPLNNTDGVRMRPAGCSVDIVPSGCIDTSIWAHSNTFPYAYDATYPKYGAGTADFLSGIGIDVEVRSPPPAGAFDAHKSDAKGLYSYLWDMDYLPNDPNYSALTGDTLGRVSDNIGQLARFKLDDNKCAATQSDPAQGFNWKKGMDLYCSFNWPYDDCAKNAGNSCTQNVNGVNFKSSCGSCQADQGALWPEDSIDDAVYGLKQFYAWSHQLTSTQDVVQLKIQMDNWYPDALTWVGEHCTGTNADTCYDGGGRLRNYRDRLGLWQTWVSNWLTATNYTSDSAWCLPTTSSGMSSEEVNYINAHSGNSWGSIDSVNACLDYNTNNDLKLKTCGDDVIQAIAVANAYTCPPAPPCDPATLPLGTVCPGPPYCPPPVLSLPASCANLPRAASGIAPPFFSWDIDQGASYLAWVQNNHALALAQKLRFIERAAFLRGMQSKALTASAALANFKPILDEFIDGAAVRALFDARNNVDHSATNVLPNFVIYGWRDDPKDSNMKAYWHIVRSEVDAPGNCPWGKCQTNRLAWVRTYTKGFLGMTRCYELTDHSGLVRAQVSRWDQNHYFPIFFNNKFQLWQALFNKPGTAVDPEGLDKKIEDACGGQGLSNDTINSLHREGMTDNSKDGKNLFKGAFMLNGNDNGTCWQLVNMLLGKGVTSTACARYFLNTINGQSHIDLKFENCNNL